MTLPVGLDLTGRRALVVGGAPVVVRAARALVGAGARLDVVSPWLCEELEELALSGEVGWAARDYAGPADLDDAWFVVVGSGDSAVDEAVRADALAERVWSVDASGTADGDRSSSTGTASLPATARLATPDGAVTVATHSPADPVLAADVTRAVDALLGQGALDLRRRSARPGAGWVALVGGGPGAD
ncbi:MAG: bifunctional precorrin-2 dehydrogenase/sirohydrochlorin ferrochelatase, partial [Ornithinibacter sp.]